MAGQTGQSPLFQKYGAKLDAAVKAHADDETKYGIIPLPPGITSGVAKLVECKFGIYAKGDYKGEYYFRAAGVVCEPASVTFNGQEIPVVGQQTSVMIPCCDTKAASTGKITMQEEHIDRILNEMRKLAGPDFTKGKGAAQLESMAELLKKAGPYFRFSTSVRKAQTPQQADGVWENWNGADGLQDYALPTVQGVQDNSAATEGQAFNEFQSQGDPADGEEDLDLLAALAQDGNEIANGKLTELATQAGIPEGNAETPGTIQGAQTWAEVVEMIRNPPRVTASTQAGPTKPQAGKVYGLKIAVVNPRTKVKTESVVECQALTIDEKAQTVNLKNLTNGKVIYKNTPWASLIPAQTSA